MAATELAALEAWDRRAGDEDEFGLSLARSGDTLFVAARNADCTGAVYTFRRDPLGVYQQGERLDGFDVGNPELCVSGTFLSFGNDLSADGEWLASAAPRHTDLQGRVYMYRRVGDRLATACSSLRRSQMPRPWPAGWCMFSNAARVRGVRQSR